MRGMTKEFWYRCRRCDHVWGALKELPIIRLPGVTTFRDTCPKCGKRENYPYREQKAFDEFEGV
jgi:DNA-directed RNA polymerase subunit M/transcription elongation factor TFIIS